MSITIAGLGPGDPAARTVAVERALRNARRIILRTAIHPGIEDLLLDSRVSSCDDLYETLLSFDEIYQAVASRVIDAATEGSVLFAVPGHPSFGERAVRLVLDRASRLGIQVDILPAVGAPDAIANLVGADLLSGEVQFVDALELRSMLETEPFAAGRLTLDPARPVLVGQVYDHQMAVATKLALGPLFPEGHEISIVTAAGVVGIERIVRCPLALLDRQEVDHLTSVWVPALPPLAALRSEQTLRRVIARLRMPDGCPWDREQTHESLRSAMLEETYEVVDAIDAGDPAQLCEELGDLLANILMHAQIATEAGEFTKEDIVEGINQKLIRRHPHIFGDAEAQTTGDVITLWQRIKEQERAADSQTRSGNVFDQLPRSMPALARAVTLLRRQSDLARVRAPAAPDSVGERLLAAVEQAIALGLDPERELNRALQSRLSPTDRPESAV